jgi:hypothetical protein
MKITTLYFALVLSLTSFAQLNQIQDYHLHPELPKGLMPILAPENSISELLEAQERALNNGRVIPVAILIENQNKLQQKMEWSIDHLGNTIGRLQIEMKNATGIGLYFSEFFLPLGSRLIFHDGTGNQMLGPYSFTDNIDSGSFSSGLILGSKMVVELFIPKGVETQAKLHLSHIAYHRDPNRKNSSSRGFDDSDDCQVNVACKEGDNWSDQKQAVVRILLKVDNFLGWCSGTVLNNTKQDCTPYILTADHCRISENGTKASEQDYEDWEFYFKYESKKCSNPSSENDVTLAKLTGCTYKASSDNGGEGDSDFLLLELKNQIPQFYDVFYAGWDANNNAPTSGVMIHHPMGDIKKISTYTTQAESSEWDDKVKNTHWKVYWSKTSNGFGVSEGGSSGSALWNQQGRVVGKLTGGASACKTGDGKSPYNPDYFGKLFYSWYVHPDDSTKNVKHWLDASQSARIVIDGIKWPCSEPSLSISETTEENNSLGFTLMPNPSNGKLTISWDSEVESTQVKIYNSMGSKVVDISNYPKSSPLNLELKPGIYFVFAGGVNHQVESQTLIIQ